MKIFLIIFISIFIILGFLLSLIAIYASPDNQVHWVEAGYFWIGNSISILGLLYFLKKT